MNQKVRQQHWHSKIRRKPVRKKAHLYNRTSKVLMRIIIQKKSPLQKVNRTKSHQILMKKPRTKNQMNLRMRTIKVPPNRKMSNRNKLKTRVQQIKPGQKIQSRNHPPQKDLTPSIISKGLPLDNFCPSSTC